MIQEILTLQQDSDSIVVIQPHIAGHVHTKDAYQDFIEQKDAEEVNLYKAIMSAPLPEGVTPMTARYVMPWDYEKDPSLIDEYSHAIKYVQTCSLEINQNNYISENLLSLWYWDDCKPRYKKIK